MRIKSCLPFSNSNPQLKRTDIIMGSISRNRMKNWEAMADNLSKAEWSWGCVSRADGKRFVVRAGEKLSAFVEVERQVLTVTSYLASIHADSCR